ncbi:MAG: LysE family translocator [Alteromonadaceae bacterium]|nr:LysE family translocator [Alteromonadaceae bacterium]
MTLTTIIALFFAMIVLALIPGPGVLTVVARACSAGLKHGFSATLGIVAGDFVFIAFALLGLSALTEVMGSMFIVVKYLGASYLIWMGVSMLLSKPQQAKANQIKAPSHFASFSAGLVTTLGNPKAILFYLSFFPAFLDLNQVTLTETFIIYATATLAIGGVTFAYAFIATKTKGVLMDSKRGRIFNLASGTTLIGTGLYMAARD